MTKDPTKPETRPIQELPQSLQDVYAELVDAYFPKGKTKMRGEAMTMMVSFMIEVRKELSTQAQLHDQEMREIRENALEVAKMFVINKMVGSPPFLVIPESKYKHYLSINYLDQLTTNSGEKK